MDLHPSEDMYESFYKYQTALLAQFDKLAEEYQFQVIDATSDIPAVFEQLKAGIGKILSGESPPLAASAAQAVGVENMPETK